MGWLIPKQGPNPSIPPKITPKIAFFDPNFTFRFPKSHKNPGMVGWVNRSGKNIPKKLFSDGFPNPENTPETCKDRCCCDHLCHKQFPPRARCQGWWCSLNLGNPGSRGDKTTETIQKNWHGEGFSFFGQCAIFTLVMALVRWRMVEGPI